MNRAGKRTKPLGIERNLERFGVDYGGSPRILGSLEVALDSVGSIGSRTGAVGGAGNGQDIICFGRVEDLFAGNVQPRGAGNCAKIGAIDIDGDVRGGDR